MKAHHLLFQNSIDVNPRMGTIKLNEKRMALMSVEALGFLRRDLVATLGIERAKGFLLRYGWTSGYNDADSIEKMYTWKSKKELILAGPAIHTLEGVVTVEPDELEFSEDKFYMSGYWRYSFEAEEHIRHFGYSDETVCWMLVGYATGFLERVTGMKVVIYETSCVGRGDDHCYFVAQSVDRCEPQYLEILRYYEEDSLVTELDKMYNEVKTLNHAIIRSEEFNKHLTSLLLEGKDLAYLVEVISKAIGKSVIIDREGLNRPLESLFIQETDFQNYQNFKRQERLSIHDTIYVFNIMSNNLCLARMLVVSSNEISKEERMMIESALSVLSIHLYTQRYIAKSLWRKKVNFFEELLDNKYDTEQILQNANHLFDFNFETKNRVIVIRSVPECNNEDIRSILTKTYPSNEIFMKKEYVVMIANETIENELVCTKFLLDIEDLLQRNINHTTFYVGAGRVSDSINEIGESYKDAFRISNFLSLAYPTKNKVAVYEQLDPIMLFLNSMEPKELLNFCKKTLGKLMQYDENNEANLIQTLKSYLDNNGNLNQTASELNLSIPGLRYRLDKIKSLCEIDFKTGQGCFHGQIAIQTYYTIETLKS
ncbi:XylR N-terminal domain-containing protein [Alkalihalobacterium elongatum]|uniref:XylR N-terminal domain-containing protein n=1 Tax=Alkalihalobacterium elongatum TaxID=2675466 RepID=UPI001C1FC7C8|nr:XylR N-terminal domain-containing protein [Alkalihalobacterium elongatum]